MSKQRPILLSTGMVQAVHGGRKTQTRRIVKANLDHECWVGCEDGYISAPPEWSPESLKSGKLYCGNCGHHALNPVRCPYGKLGDILYVRETWRKYYKSDGYGYIDYYTPIIEYAADNPEPLCMEDGDGFRIYNKDGSEKMIPWRPSIHMPKEVARIFLRITDIRVERLQDITEEDAKAEGVYQFQNGTYKFYVEPMPATINSSCSSAKDSFFSLWRTINGPESLKDNDWVWVVCFERTDKPESI